MAGYGALIDDLLQSRADTIGVAVARNEHTHYKTFWAMVIADKSPPKERNIAVKRERQESDASFENPVTAVKNFVCKYLC